MDKILVRDRLAYLPVPKNASTTFISFFKENGFIETDIGDVSEDLFFFGHIQDPHVRHTKGVAEYVRKNKPGLDISECHELLVAGIFDVHTYPISSLYPNHYNRTAWIPMKVYALPVSCNQITNYFFKKNNIEMIIPLDYAKHPGNPSFKELCAKIQSFKENRQDLYNQTVRYMMAEDFRLYDQAISSFKEQKL